jgi:hypothetical protein
VSGAGGDIPGAVFDPAERHFAQLTGFLSGPEAAAMEHQELDEHLLVSLREAGRRLYQGHLELRAAREGRLPEVTGSDEVTRKRAEKAVPAPWARCSAT